MKRKNTHFGFLSLLFGILAMIEFQTGFTRRLLLVSQQVWESTVGPLILFVFAIAAIIFAIFSIVRKEPRVEQTIPAER